MQLLPRTGDYTVVLDSDMQPRCITRTTKVGNKELREINMEFNARYVHGEDMPGRSGCGYK